VGDRPINDAPRILEGSLLLWKLGCFVVVFLKYRITNGIFYTFFQIR